MFKRKLRRLCETGPWTFTNDHLDIFQNFSYKFPKDKDSNEILSHSLTAHNIISIEETVKIKKTSATFISRYI